MLIGLNLGGLASHPARSLLLELGRQLNGRNNGHLQLTESWLTKRGWARNTPARARNELIERGLIVLTRQGGKNIGPSFFAVTWLTIDNFIGLDIGRANYHRGAWALMDKMPMPSRSTATPPPARSRMEVVDTGSGNTTYPPSAGVAGTVNLVDFAPSRGVEAACTAPRPGVNLPHALG